MVYGDGYCTPDTEWPEVRDCCLAVHEAFVRLKEYPDSRMRYEWLQDAVARLNHEVFRRLLEMGPGIGKAGLARELEMGPLRGPVRTGED